MSKSADVRGVPLVKETPILLYMNHSDTWPVLLPAGMQSCSAEDVAWISRQTHISVCALMRKRLRNLALTDSQE